jgi:hypothetical protein
MPYRLKFDNPNAGEGAQFSIHGLGTFTNGKTYEVSDEAAETFRRSNATIQQELNDEGMATSSELVPGPALDEVQMFGVTVTKVGDEAAPQNQEVSE